MTQPISSPRRFLLRCVPVGTAILLNACTAAPPAKTVASSEAIGAHAAEEADPMQHAAIPIGASAPAAVVPAVVVPAAVVPAAVVPAAVVPAAAAPAVVVPAVKQLTCRVGNSKGPSYSTGPSDCADAGPSA